MMRIISLVWIILFLHASNIMSTSINGRFTIIEDNFQNFTIMLQINTDTGIDDLGGTTILFSFDTTAISFPNNPIKDVDYIFHNFSGGSYSTAKVTKPMKNKIWVNIDLPSLNNNSGTIVTAYPNWTDVVTIKFSRINPGIPPGVCWLFNSLFWGIFDADNMTLWDTGGFEGRFGLSVQIKNGWNLVSVPGINPEGQSINDWWSGRDATSNVYKFIDGIYLPTNITLPGEGYWLKHIGNNIYNTGDEWPDEGIQTVPHFSITAKEGWNLIGGYENIVSINNLTTTPPGLITGLTYTYSNEYQISENLEPGRGYLIKLTGDGQINIPGGIGNGSGGANDFFNDEWGKITITDSLGRSYSLYLADGEISLDLYELPPIPPFNLFDIRFESGRIVENINNGPQTILMNGIVHPVYINVQNINVTFLDELGKRIGSEMMPGEDIIITKKSTKRLIILSNESNIPISHCLEQNYPNPFNPTTKIKYNVPTASLVKLKIYDVLGKEVATLVDEYVQPGRFVVEWNAENFSSGVYFYSIQSDDFVQTKKMILLK